MKKKKREMIAEKNNYDDIILAIRALHYIFQKPISKRSMF